MNAFPDHQRGGEGQQNYRGPPFFNTVNIPLGLLLLLLTGIGPLIAWRRASIANLRRQFLIPAGTAATIRFSSSLGVHDLAALLSYSFGAGDGDDRQNFKASTPDMHATSRLIALPRLMRAIARYGRHRPPAWWWCSRPAAAFKRE